MMPQRVEPMKIVFFSMDGMGHLLACIGMAQALAKRGHEIHFLLNETYKGQVSKFGFHEFLLKKSSAKQATDAMAEQDEEEYEDEEEHEYNPLKQLAERRKATGLFSAKSTLEKLRGQKSASILLKEMYDSLVDYHPQMGFAINRINPDFIIVDHFLIPPAIPISGVPWAFLCSSNPLCLHNSEKLPPFGSGYSPNSDPASWREFKTLLNQKLTKSIAQFQKKLNDRFYYKPRSYEQVQHGMFFQSQYINIYQFPQELDYVETSPLSEEYARVDAFCYSHPGAFQLPEHFVNRNPDEKLVYVSLGTIGSVDVDLLQRVTAVLGTTKHKYIICKGPRANEYELPDNCIGDEFLPQTSILPLVDLVISHGGNNTVTESLSFGKPMVVLPVHSDQHDNAQRITEKGFGVKLETYKFSDQELISAIDHVLTDQELNVRVRAVAKRIELDQTKESVCVKIEQLVQRLRY